MLRLAALASLVALAAVASPAAAQMAPYGMPNAANGYSLDGWGMPDFTGVDLGAVNDAWNAPRDAAMGQLTSQIVGQVLQNPYAMQVIQSGACGIGSAEQLAYVYAATAGCTPAGIAEYGRVTDGIMRRDEAVRSGF